MQRSHFKRDFTTTFIGVLVLLLGATLGFGQQQVSLTAAPTTATLPDGQCPMWGYTCGAAVSGSTATCAASNPASAAAGRWSPVVITVPTNQQLQINLTNHLIFVGPTVLSTNRIPTSLTIVGQLGGGLGSSATANLSPQHENLSTTWPIANTGPVFVPPTQPSRVQSLATEVAAGATTSLTWSALRPGTYLLESGTHPSIQGPMGLYGIVVVTAAPGVSTPGTAYPNVSYNADVPLLLSEIDPAQNKAVDSAVRTAGFSESATLGPYSAQPLASINLINGGSGYTSAPTVSLIGGGCTTGCPTVTAVVDGDSTSPTYQQVTELDFTSGGNFTSAPTVSFSGGGGGTGAVADAALQLATSSTCSGSAAACYPPAVNYTPLYYLINGQAFDKSNPGNSLFAAAPNVVVGPGTAVLVRMVNAGLRMHVPSIVGAQTGASGAAGFSLIAEDGNPLPGVPRIQSEVFMAAGKTYDVLINAPQPNAGTPPAALPIYDRELSLSGNSTFRDAGMLAYINVNGAGLPSSLTTGLVIKANADTYNAVVPGKTLTISDFTKGVIANDVNILHVAVTVAPTKGTLTLNTNGTFTYAANSTWSGGDSFTYCGNGASTANACTTVTLGAEAIESASGITCTNSSYTASTALTLKINTPGVLAGCKDAAGYPLTVDLSTVTPAGSLNVVADANGGFLATVPAAGGYTFTFKPVNSQGTQGSNAATATLTFPAGSGLAVTVLDGANKSIQIQDYRWVIEEDRTFYVDPNCIVNNTTNPAPGCA